MNSQDLQPKRFLIVKTSSLGDIIHAFPLLNYLKQKFPSAQVDWVVEKQFAELVRAHPLVNETLCIETKKWRKGWLKRDHLKEINAFRQLLQKNSYDAVFDLQGNVKSGLITSLAKSAHKIGFGKNSVPEWPNLLFTNCRFNPPTGQNIRQDYLFLAQSFFADTTPWDWGNSAQVKMHIPPELSRVIENILNNPVMQGHKKIMVCPGSAWRNKQLHPTALADLLKLFQLKLNGSFLFVWGTEEEKQLAQQLQLQFSDCSQVVERLPLPGLQNLMNQVDLVIAMDSLPLHLAGTTKTATFSIFGASLAEKYKPLGPQHLTYQGGCPYKRTFEKRCPILRSCPTGACIQSLQGNELFEYFRKQSFM